MKIANAQIDFYIQKIAEEKIAGCLIFGPETAVINYRFDLIAKKIAPDLSDPFLVSNLSKERLTEDKGILADEFFSFSMLGGRKLILVKDIDIGCAAALKILFEDKEFAKKSDNFILIQAGDLDKGSALRNLCEDNKNFAAIACYEDDERVIKKFIESELAKRQIKSSSQLVEILLEKFGKNRQIILSELEKISLYLGEGKELNLDKISKISGLETEISANEFISSFAAKKFDLAILQAEKLFKNGFEPIALMRFLSNYLQKLYQAKCDIEFAGLDFEEAVKAQRLFFKTEIEFRKSLKLLSLNFLTKNLQRLSEFEIKMKNSLIAPKLLFISFVQQSKYY
ncbi:MAG: DNA polymerase III subunit delta [Proteobacteria bacterium]|nr:DNA polymerase III subunit delta [Pseudomonadota bacterium]